VVVAAERVRDRRRRPLLVLLTDGRATAAGGVPAAERAAAGLAARGVPGVVVDTEDAAVRLGLAPRVAAALGAPCVRLEQLAAGTLAAVVRAATGRAA
jgi:magnesium chelatase subunit D